MLDQLVTRGGLENVEPGQVSGNYAVWTQCRGDFAVCDVVRYDIARKTGTIIPNTFANGRLQWHPAVTVKGTVYFIHETHGSQCGERVMLVRSAIGGPNTVLVRFKKGDEVMSTFADDSSGAPVVYYNRYRCGDPAGDIYKILD